MAFLLYTERRSVNHCGRNFYSCLFHCIFLSNSVLSQQKKWPFIEFKIKLMKVQINPPYYLLFVVFQFSSTEANFQKNHLKGEEPLTRIPVSDIRSVTKLVNKMGYGLQVPFAKGFISHTFIIFDYHYEKSG